MKIADHNKIRNAMLDGAIRTVADFGMEGVTARRISDASKMNEAYIYRYFENYNALLETAFIKSDKELVALLNSALDKVCDLTDTLQGRIKAFFAIVWDEFMDNIFRSKFYVRYFNSSMLTGDLKKEHYAICESFISRVTPYFADSSDVTLISHHVVFCLQQYIMNVADGVMENTPETRNKIFMLMGSMVAPFLKGNI